MDFTHKSDTLVMVLKNLSEVGSSKLERSGRVELCRGPRRTSAGAPLILSPHKALARRLAEKKPY